MSSDTKALSFWDIGMRGALVLHIVFVLATLVSFALYGWDRVVFACFVGTLVFFFQAGFCHTQATRERDEARLLAATLASEQYRMQRAGGPAPASKTFSDFADDTGDAGPVQPERTPNP